MKYTVEVVCTNPDVSSPVVHRIKIDEPGPRQARAKAQLVLGAWRNWGGKIGRVLDRRNKQLCSVSWPSWAPADWYCDMQMRIGQELRTHCKPPRNLPDLMLALLLQMDEQQDQ